MSIDTTKGNRKVFSAVVQLITGHNFLNRHSAIVEFGYYPTNDDDDAKCSYCNEAEESSFHIFAECDRFAALRLQIFGQDQLTQPFSVKNKQIVQFLRESKVEALHHNLLL